MIKEVLRLLILGIFTQYVSSGWIEDDIEAHQTSNQKIVAQLQMQQQFMEERIRGEGSSGVKQIRLQITGNENYHSPSHGGSKFLAIHSHANHYNTVGMGELAVVMNGVEFRTRHNDYLLRMPHRTSEEFGAAEELPYPPTPPAVLAKATVDEQVAEMKLWFKAWQDQDYSVRDYRPYFKPILCYIEAGWMQPDGDKVQEMASSDRHSIHAVSWEELQKKINFNAHSGAKNQGENYAFLPTTVLDIANGTEPIIGQWNYRIMCHQLKNDLPLSHLIPVDDLASRKAAKHTMEKYLENNGARFRLCPEKEDCSGKEDTFTQYEYLDELMGEVPGLNNYPANIKDTVFNRHTKDVNTYEDLNTGYYHRWYRSSRLTHLTHRRGFNDENIFMAMTTHEEMASMELPGRCYWKDQEFNCYETYKERWTYALPLEIIYLTPLHAWNPYNFTYRGDASSEEGQLVTRHDRTGYWSGHRAYDGINSETYYLTPLSMFYGDEVNQDAADTAVQAMGVLDQNREVRRAYAAGVRVSLPSMTDLGVIRQRYPIAAVHGEGGAAWKELNALKDLVIDHKKYSTLYPEGSPFERTTVMFMTDVAEQDETGNVVPHFHMGTLTFDQTQIYKLGYTVETTSGPSDNGPEHSHAFKLRYKKDTKKLEFYSCDGLYRCEHKHELIVIEGK